MVWGKNLEEEEAGDVDEHSDVSCRKRLTSQAG